MTRLLNFISSIGVILVFAIGTSTTNAQTYLNTVGNPSFGVNIPVPNGYINISNGNLHLEIPLTTSKQRGALNLNERLVYDSRIWEIVQYNNHYWWPLNVPNSQAGWRFVKGNETGTLATVATSIQNTSCWTGIYNQPYTIATAYYSWTDPTGTVHPFNASSTSYTVPSNCPGFTPGTVTTGQSGYAGDASGYYATVTPGSNGAVSVTVRDSSGTQVYPQVIDRFGNYWSSDANGNLIDDLGRTPVIVTPNGNVTYYDVLAPNGPISNNGTRVRYTVTTEQVTVTTAFNQSGVTEYQNNGSHPTTIPAIQSIQLPDGSQYQFHYDSYGEIQSETLPTGGGITYGWSNYTDSYQNVNRWIKSSIIDSATTTYTPAVISQCSSSGTGCQESVNVHRPSGDETVYTLTLNNGAWDTNSTIYQGAASNNQPKVSSVTTYNFTQTCSIPGCNGAQNVTKSSEVETLLDTNVATQIQTVYSQPQTGQLTSWSQWDYYPVGSSPSSTPTRQVQYGYTNYDLTLETHYDQNGNVASTTQYNYTANAIATSGIVSHGTANAGGPYLTSVTKTNNSPSTTITASSTYDDTGSVQTSQDYNQNPVTSYKYDPTDTFVIETDRPTTGSRLRGLFSHVSKASYDPNSGALVSTDDENSVANGQAYTLHYTYEAVAGRLNSITFPDGGSTTYAYPSSTEVDTTVAQNSSTSITSASIADTYGRRYQVASGGLSSETSYDGNGRVFSVSTPHLSTTSPTDGYTYTYYDTLDRITSVVLSDNNSKSVTYIGNTLTTRDELGNQKSETFDAFGEITSVTEADPATGALDLQTVYQRDGLGNVICVEQHGNVSGTGCGSSQSSDSSSPWRVRRFYYNALSQLRAAEIPEHMSLPSYAPSQNCGTPDNQSQWTDCYTYDNNGNRLTATDNTGITNTYAYDFLNRPTSESSTNLLKLYTYDGGTNGAGRLWTQSNEILNRNGDNGPNAQSIYSYDVMGRVTTESACRSGCGSPRGGSGTISVGYDLSGNATAITYPDGRVIQNTYDTLNRPATVNYQQWGSQLVGTAYWSAPSYAPPGELTAATYGNGMQVQANFSNRQSITSLSYQANSAAIFSKSYLWDKNAANLIKETNTVNGQQRQFGYDKLNRLTAAYDVSNTGSQSTGTATVSGTDGSTQFCTGGGGTGPEVAQSQAQAQPNYLPPVKCTTTWDTGNISLTVGGYTVSAPYSRFSNGTSLATSLTSLLNASGSPVTATSSGGVITMSSLATGTAADYALSWSTDNDFSMALSGSNMTGGQSGAPTPGGLNQQYTLDAWGNLSQMGGSSGFSQSINNQNQVGAYQYDAAGRLLSDQINSYTYDSNGMLSTSSDGATYTYDGNGQRGSVVSGGSETDYYYFGGRLYAIANGSGWTDLLYAGGARIGEVAGNQTATPIYSVLDHIGSEVATTDSTGAVLSAMDYTPFGQLLSGSNSDGFVFSGLLRDNGGLDHADFRQYSSITGRWVTPDSYSGSYSFENPQTLNRYSYVQENPLFLRDPSGLISLAPSSSSGDGLANEIGQVFVQAIEALFRIGKSDFKGSTKPRPTTYKASSTAYYKDPSTGEIYVLGYNASQYAQNSAYSLSYAAPVFTVWTPPIGEIPPLPVASITLNPQFTYIPRTKTICAGSGVGIATGTGEGVTFTISPSDDAEYTENVVSGYGFTYQAQPFNFAGVSNSTNPSGSLLGYSIASSTGLSAAFGWMGCHAF